MPIHDYPIARFPLCWLNNHDMYWHLSSRWQISVDSFLNMNRVYSSRDLWYFVKWRHNFSVMVSQISSDSTVYSVVSLGKNKQQSSRYWPFAKEIHRWPRNAFLCHDVIIPTLLVESMYIFVFQLPFLVNFFTEIYVTIIDEFQKTTMNCCVLTLIPWWRHQMETFSALLAICAGNSPVHGEFPAQRLVTRSFHIFFDLRLNKRLHKQLWGWWFETLSCPLWRQCNVLLLLGRHIQDMIQNVNISFMILKTIQHVQRQLIFLRQVIIQTNDGLITTPT